MPLFLTILEGATPDEARPILAIRDAQILATVRTMIHARLRDAPSPRPRSRTVLRRMPQEDQEVSRRAI